MTSSSDHQPRSIPSWPEVRFYPTRLSLPTEIRVQVAKLLNQVLVTTIDLRAQFKQAQWNVKGKHFYQLYLLFGEIATHFETYSDQLAERVATLGLTAIGTVHIVVQDSILPDYSVPLLMVTTM